MFPTYTQRSVHWEISLFAGGMRWIVACKHWKSHRVCDHGLTIPCSREPNRLICDDDNNYYYVLLLLLGRRQRSADDWQLICRSTRLRRVRRNLLPAPNIHHRSQHAATKNIATRCAEYMIQLAPSIMLLMLLLEMLQRRRFMANSGVTVVHSTKH